jgi:hypothetical protein
MSTLRRWFIPNQSGDFRLEHVTDTTSLLTVEDPTPADLIKLRPFLVEARKLNWVDASAGVQPRGRTEIPVAASVTEVGPFLSGVIYMPNTPLWLVVRHTNGEISILDVQAKALRDEAEAMARQKAEEEAARERNRALKQAADEAEEEAKRRARAEEEARKAELERVRPAPTPETVATVRPPARGCPAPLPANRRASEVLAAFSTPEQLEDLARSVRSLLSPPEVAPPA